MNARALRAVLLIAAAAPGIGQNEAEPYFALSSNRTFSARSKPSVGMSAFNVKSLEFRVYRVNDPIKFFQQLEDSHNFGGRNPPPPRERTVLERIHDWKRGVRAGIRRTLRGQFTESPSQHLSSILPRESQPVPTKGTQFAEAPVLNPQQLVLTFNHNVRAASRWETQNVEVPVKDKGIYLVEAVHKDLRAYTILIVSDLVMIAKTGRGRIVTFLTDRNTGEPSAGVDVHMFQKEQKAVTVKTNADGLAELPMTASRPDDVRLVARRGPDSAVFAMANYAFTVNREQWSGYLYTDRPVYRPGHTVNFKGIIRVKSAAGLSIPSGKAIAVTINDPDQKPVYQKTLTATNSGAIRDTFTLGPSAALGYYNIEARSGEEFMSGSFEVQEYKKPEYEVRVTAARSRVLQGETVQATIDARYYFGEPVAGAKVKYSVYRSRYWFPLWYDAEDSTEGDGGPPPMDDDDPGDQLSDQEAVLDADGKLNISFETKPSENRFDYVYRVEARVTDAGNREISGSGFIVATYGSFVLNVAPVRYFYQPNSRAAFRVEARDYEFKPIQTRVHVELQTWSWRERDRHETKAATDVNTLGDGSATGELTIPATEGGSYRIRVSAKSAQGREVEQYAYIWIAGRGEFDYGSGERKTIQIIPDKKSYRPGETAHVLIVTGKANTPVLVSVEGRDLRSHKLIRSTDETAVLDVPITFEDEPAIFVGAQFIRKGELYQSVKRIKVPPEEHKLNVQIATDKPQYLPGQTASYTLNVTDAAGKPVPRAEFSLGVVDEAIYAIRRDTTPDILSFFFGREWNTVYTGTSLEYFFSGEAGKRRMRLASLRPPSKLAQLKPERLVKPKVRKVFPDTAFWSADIVTDANGKAVAKVAFPDSLTTWRATARGITPDTKVGAGTLKTIVRKNLILRLAVPRFFVQGDEIVLSALVHNYLTTEKTARVSLKVDGLDVMSGQTQDVRIPSRGEAKVEWRVRAKPVRTAKVYGEALTDEESDALELDLPVNPPGVKLALAKGGSLSGSTSTAFALTYPPQVEPGSRSILITTSPSIVGSLFSALEYLTSFPYGCVEQTMSGFLPNIIVGQAISELKLKSNVNQADLNEKIRAGLERLYGFQHDDGGWGWWETDDSHPFMTAYVVAGLVQAKAAGTRVNEEAIRRGADWLVKNKDTRWLPDLRAYIAYALSLAGKTGELPPLDRLSPYGLAIAGQFSDRKAEIATLLEKAVKQDQTQAWWPASRDEMLDFSADVTPEATAYAVKFLAKQTPGSPLLPKAAVWLMNHRNEGYWWSSTKQTAMVIYGLIDYLKVTKELNPNLTATVYVNDQPVLTKKFESAVDAPEIRLDESKLKPGENRIRIVSAGDGRLYYSARAEFYSTEEKLQKTGSVSLNLLRDYFRLAPQKDGEKIVYDLTPLDGAVAPGDTIAVRLTVTGSDWKYLLVEDPIPAGTEFIERDNLYQLKSRPPWWQYEFTRRELHDDRMAIFQTYFFRGQQQYFYLLKVVNPGQFKVSPARVQPMYQPEFLSTTESRKLEVR